MRTERVYLTIIPAEFQEPKTDDNKSVHNSADNEHNSAGNEHDSADNEHVHNSAGNERVHISAALGTSFIWYLNYSHWSFNKPNIWCTLVR